jgi:hypothetical protein
MDTRKLHNLLVQLRQMQEHINGYPPNLMVNHRAFKKIKPILKSLGAPKEITFGDAQLVLNELRNTLEFALRERAR